MPYRYQCAQCHADADKRDRRDDAEADGQQHRDEAHHGLLPTAGDRVAKVHADGRGDRAAGVPWPRSSLLLLAGFALLVLFEMAR
ncbi:hypothetical protein RM572_00615 [Streptomyces sp. DSM 42041]|uniref:Uncharacterized protein n=1 Tax=Streptomyces hazeniae TaxID=3075538 RepID=A0ABU2NK29_9ACTN|nr:hypothetical protein [Streptomyces sp. DSM 42041]MDT0377278.1 hypothetical protein [Streptomyces sp. DSM 42041]